MKVLITSQGTSLESNVDPRFGRAPYFVLVEGDTNQVEAVENPYGDAMGGAGIQAAQLAIEKGAKVVLTGNVGPNAYATLQSAGIVIHVGTSGTVADALKKFQQGGLDKASGPSVGSKSGLGQGRRGRGRF